MLEKKVMQAEVQEFYFGKKAEITIRRAGMAESVDLPATMPEC